MKDGGPLGTGVQSVVCGCSNVTISTQGVTPTRTVLNCDICMVGGDHCSNQYSLIHTRLGILEMRNEL